MGSITKVHLDHILRKIREGPSFRADVCMTKPWGMTEVTKIERSEGRRELPESLQDGFMRTPLAEALMIDPKILAVLFPSSFQ